MGEVTKYPFDPVTVSYTHLDVYKRQDLHTTKQEKKRKTDNNTMENRN